MRHRLAGLAAATAIAAAALVACSPPPHEQPSDIKVTDQKNPIPTFEAPSESADPSGEVSPSGDVSPSGAATAPATGNGMAH